MSDLEILKVVQEDTGKFSLLYRKYVSKIYKYCYFSVNYSKEDAEDLTSQTFLQTFEKVTTIKLDKQHDFSILPYLYTSKAFNHSTLGKK